MRKLLFLLLVSQLSYAAELRWNLSKSEMQSLGQTMPSVSPEKVFPEILNKLNIQVESTFNEKSGELILNGSDDNLKITEYIYIAWIRKSPEVTLNFSHFTGSLDRRIVKHSFEKKLRCNKPSSFQYSNKLIEKVGNDINGFSFKLEPVWDPFQKHLELAV
ncbi:MAG: hypothetical protein NE327_16830, partial [Lentisphaeraceae bacterium]|nr:hypothetical protein [Lentisphaeraceae bacterium]